MKSLYFIGILTDKELGKEVTAFKKYMADNYYSKTALKSPPHITLYPPFRREENEEEKLNNNLALFAEKCSKFDIILDGFGCFKPSVIFIKPEENKQLNSLRNDLLTHLKSSLNLYDSQNERLYHPHMTIATRDLKKNYFHAAWEEFREKEFIRNFEVKSIYLLKHNGKYWEIYKEYLFNFGK